MSWLLSVNPRGEAWLKARGHCRRPTESLTSYFPNSFTFLKDFLFPVSQECRRPIADMAASQNNLARILTTSPQNAKQFMPSSSCCERRFMLQFPWSKENIPAIPGLFYGSCNLPMNSLCPGTHGHVAGLRLSCDHGVLLLPVALVISWTSVYLLEEVEVSCQLMLIQV